jgi:membrane associated rhomboid family serine protease
MFWLLPWDEDHPYRARPWATWALIVANVVAFALLATASNARAVVDEYGLVAADPRWYQFVTANFLHGSLLHLAGNMLFLCVVGDNVEDVLGPIGLLLLYFAGGLFGDLLLVHANPGLALPSIGASGCIATLAGAYALMHARNRLCVRLIFVVLPVAKVYLQALWVLLFFFGWDVYLTFESRGELVGHGGVNFVAHGIGFAFGLGVGMFAHLHGAMRRFERLPSGDAWFGYWPSRLEAPRTRRVA